MTKPIRIHAIDRTDEEVRDRHASVEARLEEMGADQVKFRLLHGGFPTEWHAIVHAWLGGDKLEPEADKSGGENAKA